jgi:hypothetical protein
MSGSWSHDNESGVILITMYRRFSIFLGLVALLLTPTAVLADPVMYQDLQAVIDPEQHSIHVQGSLTRSDETRWPVEYHLAPHAVIESVLGDGVPVRHEFSNGRLFVELPPQTEQLRLNYSVVYNDAVPTNTVGIEDPSFGVVATIQPQGVYLGQSSRWHPQPVGLKSVFSIEMTGADSLVGVTSGRLVEMSRAGDQARTLWQTKLPEDRLSLAAGPYELHQDNLGDIQVMAFMSRDNAALASGYLASIREYLALYQDLFGPYPYEKYAVVENFYPTGYGLPGWTLLGSSVIRLPFIRMTSLPHEIAHAWWGNAIEIDYTSGNWGEGLATYVADYYVKERNDPLEALEYRRKLLRDYAALAGEGNTMSLASFRGRMSKRDQAVGYGKTAMVFHMLREQIGDEAFWKALQNMARDGLGQRYSWADLERHFSAVSDVDLDRFFNQWVQRPGAPSLSLSDVDLLQTDSGWQVSGVVSQNEPFYELAVPIELVTEERTYEQVIGFSEKDDCFVFNVSGRPVSLAVDPDNRMFRQLDPAERPATVNDLRAAQKPIVVVAKGSEALLDGAKDLLRGLQWHGAEIIPETDYPTMADKNQPVLFIGWPMASELQPNLQPIETAADRAFLSNGGLSLESDEVLFTVVKGPTEKAVQGYFLPGSLAAAEDTARRIPHYGRYSYLVFDQGRNQLKATWEPDAFPLKLVFEKDHSR